jgi:hypothetical protein
MAEPKLGDKFGQWEVIGLEKNQSALCRCSCGVEKVVRLRNLHADSSCFKCSRNKRRNWQGRR